MSQYVINHDGQYVNISHGDLYQCGQYVIYHGDEYVINYGGQYVNISHGDLYQCGQYVFYH